MKSSWLQLKQHKLQSFQTMYNVLNINDIINEWGTCICPFNKIKEQSVCCMCCKKTKCYEPDGQGQAKNLKFSNAFRDDQLQTEMANGEKTLPFYGYSQNV